MTNQRNVAERFIENLLSFTGDKFLSVAGHFSIIDAESLLLSHSGGLTPPLARGGSVEMLIMMIAVSGRVD